MKWEGRKKMNVGEGRRDGEEEREGNKIEGRMKKGREGHEGRKREGFKRRRGRRKDGRKGRGEIMCGREPGHS